MYCDAAHTVCILILNDPTSHEAVLQLCYINPLYFLAENGILGGYIRPFRYAGLCFVAKVQ